MGIANHAPLFVQPARPVRARDEPVAAFGLEPFELRFELPADIGGLRCGVSRDGRTGPGSDGSLVAQPRTD